MSSLRREEPKSSLGRRLELYGSGGRSSEARLDRKAEGGADLFCGVGG